MEKVLLLKAPPEDDERDKFEEQLSQHFQVSLVPVIEFEFCGQSELTQTIGDWEKYSGLVLTSRRAVQAVAAIHSKQMADTVPVYVVGESTAELTRASLGCHTLGAESGNAENLAQFIISNHVDRSKPLLFPCGNLAKSTLPSLLERHGITCLPVRSYTTVENCQLPHHVDRLDNLQVIVFFSPSGVTYALPHIIHKDWWPDVQIVAIGKTTAAELGKHTDKVIHVSREPSPTGVLRVLQELFPWTR